MPPKMFTFVGKCERMKPKRRFKRNQKERRERVREIIGKKYANETKIDKDNESDTRKTLTII
jgi:hypothetical protein